jgi:hypothetical protein
LHDSDAAVRLDRLQADDTVIKRAGQNHPNYLGLMRDSSGTKERINGRATMVFFGAAGQTDTIFLDEEMVVGRSYQDGPGLNRRAIGGLPDLQCTGLRKNSRQEVYAAAYVHDYHDGRGKICGQS